MRFVKVIVLCLGIGLTAQDTFAHDATGKDTLGRITPTYLLVDTAADLPIDTVVKMFAEGKFQPVNREIINLPIKDSVVWLAFRRPLTDQARQYLSPGSESTIWRATLYTLDTVGQYQPYFHFDHLRSDTRPDGLPFRTVAIPLPDKLNDDLLLLRLAARRHRNYILKTGDISTMSHYQLHKDTIPLIFIGFMLCIFIYNVFLFLSTRDIVFLPYLLYLLFVTYAVPFHNGYVLFSEEWMWQGNPFYTVWTGIGYLTGAIFAILYLDLKNTAPRFRVWIILLTFILVVIVPLLDVSRWFHVGIMAKIVSTTSLVFNLSLWFSGLYVWIKGRIEHAHYYVLGWLFAIAGMVLFILSTNGIIPYTDFVEQSFFYGFAIEAVLFAFALGDRMNVLKKEKRALEVEYLDYTKEQNWLLAQQSFMNSHLLRAPLSRILGLLNLLKFTHSKEESDLYIEHIERSTVEMDGIAKKMSVMLEKEGYMNQYETEFNEVRKSIYEGNEEEQGDDGQQHNES
ncbi:sensor histidine kinase [Reichenbachiella agariperforans]|uniref:sensor histidine kinase n=1 Tax=Reichenbachiella agariperforans TaxID=156994 RepID=UPI001C0A116C|nr:7TM diverse intracellular signaling domain-containing protein [Reichenbachiella agariperforans]MBU2913257.1 hypothetical protein [Reichenbachiella agariperforans]